MQQIADWLEKLGMSEYAQRFAENRIDFEILPDLTDQDLEKLGVVLGEPLRILGHAEVFEPVRNLLHRGHQGPVVATRQQRVYTGKSVIARLTKKARLDPPPTSSAGAGEHTLVRFWIR